MKKILLTSLMTFGIVVSLLASNPQVQAHLSQINNIVHFDAQQMVKAEALMNAFAARKEELKTKITDQTQLKKAVQIEAKSFQDKLLAIMTDAQKKAFFAAKK